jgi:outer membrane protein OmpA-like peptidoglycan-associated protein
MAAGCKKCDPHEICEECPEWIFTLADLIMCMMGLFVILWVLKPGPKPEDKQKMTEEQIKVFAAIREAFKYEPDPNSQDPIDMEILLRKLQTLKPHLGPGEGGETKIKREGAEGTDPEVTKIRYGKRAGVGGRLLFMPAGAELSPDAKREVEQIAEKIRGHRQIVFVKGHTALDDFKEDATPQRQMDLSIRRAQAVADYLTTLKVSPDVLRVQGCSTFEPVVQRAYADGQRLLNRRVEVEVTDTIVEERQDSARSTQPGLPPKDDGSGAGHSAEAAVDHAPAH